MTFDLEILLPGKLKPDTALSLTKHFPQLHIFDSESHDKLRDECMDCILSPSDLPKHMECTTGGQVGRYWWEVGKIVPFKGEPRFPILTKLMRGLLTIPASNDDSTLFTKSFLYNISSHDDEV